MFFIGSYRDNEVSEDHIVHGFLGWLSNFGVPVNSVQLGGLGERDVNFTGDKSLDNADLISKFEIFDFFN